MPFNQTGRISKAIVAVAGKPFRLADYFSGLLGQGIAQQLIKRKQRSKTGRVSVRYG